MPAIYWRVDGGYKDAPKTPPQPAPPSPQNEQVMQFQPCLQNYAVSWMFQPYQTWQGYQQWQQPPVYLPGPLYFNGLASPPPEYGTLSPPPPGVDGCIPPVPPKEDKKKGKEDDAKSQDKKEKNKNENLHAPPKMPVGCLYMFDKKHTMVHVFNKTSPIWEENYWKMEQKFKMFKVSVNFTVKMVIENVLRKEGDPCKGWAATEAVELGGGKWAKGSTIEYDNDKSKGTLKEMSWSEKRGDKLPPVWLVVHKV